MRTIVFTAQSMYARFRCPYTTTSALTYTTIHPVAVKGLIGAVMGVEYSDLYEYSYNMRVGIQVINPVYKDMQSFNLIAMVKNNGAQNFQSRVQFLRDVKYRIFILDNDEKLDNIEKVLKSKTFVFTPYLGCSEHVAKLDFEAKTEIKACEKNNAAHTIIPKQNAIVEEDRVFDMHFDRIPIKNSQEREYIDYKEVVFSPGNSIKTNNGELFKVGDYNVFYF